MSTRSRIGIENPDGTIRSIYCHFDGYPDGVGDTLIKHYSDPVKLRQLIDLGSISILGEEIGEQHDFNARRDFEDSDPRSKWTLAYGRDRGETDVDAILSPTREKFLSIGEEYNYILTADLGWLVADSNDKFVSLEVLRASEKESDED